MALDSCGKLSRVMMFVFNLIVFLAGIAMLALGIFTIVTEETDTRYNIRMVIGTTVYESVAVLLVVAGFLVLVIAFLGCCGAIVTSRCMLLTYFILLLIIFIILTCVVVIGMIFKSEIKDRIAFEVVENIKETYGINVNGDDSSLKNKMFTQSWDQVQRDLDCCAVSNSTTELGYLFWEVSRWCRGANTKLGDKPKPPNGKLCVPRSCCGLPDVDKLNRWCTAETVSKVDCFNRSLQALKNNTVVGVFMGGISIGLVFVMFLGMSVSLLLYVQLGHSKNK